MELQIFTNDEFGQVRTIMKDGEPWFVGKDVAAALGYRTASEMVRMIKDADKGKHLVYTPGGNQTVIVINDSGLYNAAFRSKVPSAQKFRDWVTSEVLPQIRKTGGYIPIKEEDSEMDILSKAILIAQKTLAQKDALIAQQNKIIEDKDQTITKQKPLVDFAVQVADTTNLIDMKGMAKLLKDENITIGRTRLFDWLRNKKILMSDNTPYQNYIERGYFVVKESLIQLKNGNTKTSLTTYITGKGQIYIVNRIKKEYITS